MKQVCNSCPYFLINADLWLYWTVTHVITILDLSQQDLKGHEFEERLSKERANALLNRARKECKVQNPSDNPELMEMFNDFPNELDRLDDMIHDLQAQAEMCVGTDENVRRTVNVL